MGKSKKRYGELRFIDFCKGGMKYWKKVERRGKGGWKFLGIIDCKDERLEQPEFYLTVEDMEEIIMYIKLNREIWRRYAYPSANVLGLSLKKCMSVRDTRELPVESFHKIKHDALHAKADGGSK
jgi:hypothetical protein